MIDGLDRGRLRFVEADGMATRVYEAGEGEHDVGEHDGCVDIQDPDRHEGDLGAQVRLPGDLDQAVALP